MLCVTRFGVSVPPVWMIICMCAFLFASQFECVWSQMPMNEQAKLQSREFLKLFGAQGRTAHTEAERPTNNVPPPPPEPRETATESCCPNTAAAILQRTKVHDRIDLCYMLSSLLYIKNIILL